MFDALEAANASYVDSGAHRSLPVRPARQLAVLTCMDARIDVFAVLGLELGDVHVLRTAGARVTDDVLRSLTLSTHALGTRELAVIAHTDCGLHDPDHRLRATLEQVMGRPPRTQRWYEFQDPAAAVESDCAKLLSWPDRPEGFRVAGYVLDVEDGRLERVVEPTRATPPV